MALPVIKHYIQIIEGLIEERKREYPYDAPQISFLIQAIGHLKEANKADEAKKRDSLLALALIKANEVGFLKEICAKKNRYKSV